MKTIIIPDLHNRVNWIENFLSSVEHDRVIFLGDYFDNFEDTSNDIELVTKWLKESIHKPNRVHLFGTHELWYRFQHNPFIFVSGNDQMKGELINSILDIEDWKYLRLYCFEQDFLITHAGLHSYLIYEFVLRNKSIFGTYIKNFNPSGRDIVDNIVGPATKEALQYVEAGKSHPWLAAGMARAGEQSVGGIIWLDWTEEFVPVPGLNQIVGHTQLDYPGEIVTEDSKNYNLDTKNRYVGMLENGKLTYIKNSYI